MNQPFKKGDVVKYRKNHGDDGKLERMIIETCVLSGLSDYKFVGRGYVVTYKDGGWDKAENIILVTKLEQLL